MKTFKQLYNEGKMDLELLKLYNKAMRVMPGSPAQKKIIDQINKRMIKLGMKPSMMQQEDGHTAVSKVRADHKREKEQAKIRRDRELDQARTQDTARRNRSEQAPNTADAMKRYKAGKAGFTDKAHLKAKGLIPRADGTKRKSDKYKGD